MEKAIGDSRLLVLSRGPLPRERTAKKTLCARRRSTWTQRRFGSPCGASEERGAGFDPRTATEQVGAQHFVWSPTQPYRAASYVCHLRAVQSAKCYALSREGEAIGGRSVRGRKENL